MSTERSSWWPMVVGPHAIFEQECSAAQPLQRACSQDSSARVGGRHPSARCPSGRPCAMIRSLEIFWLLAGMAIGLALSLATIWLRDRQVHGRARIDQRRQLYARALANDQAAYDLVDFLITWPRRQSQTALPTPGERPSTRAAAIVNNASVELDAAVRRSRDMAAEIEMIGSSGIIPLAIALRETLDDAVTALRVDSPAKLDSRWAMIGPNWQSARQRFTDMARKELGGDR